MTGYWPLRVKAKNAKHTIIHSITTKQTYLAKKCYMLRLRNHDLD